MKPALFDLLCIAGLFMLAFVFGYESGRREKNWKVATAAAQEFIERAANPDDDA